MSAWSKAVAAIFGWKADSTSRSSSSFGRNKRGDEAPEIRIEPVLNLRPAGPRPRRCQDCLDAIADPRPVLGHQKVRVGLEHDVFGPPQEAQEHQAILRALRLWQCGVVPAGAQV